MIVWENNVEYIFAGNRTRLDPVYSHQHRYEILHVVQESPLSGPILYPLYSYWRSLHNVSMKYFKQFCIKYVACQYL